jgi:hypothetical protein
METDLVTTERPDACPVLPILVIINRQSLPFHKGANARADLRLGFNLQLLMISLHEIHSSHPFEHKGVNSTDFTFFCICEWIVHLNLPSRHFIAIYVID